MEPLEPQKYGDISPLVTAATSLLSAAWALTFGILGRRKWYPNGEALQGLVTRISVVVAALGIANVYYTLSDPDRAGQLKGFLWPASLVSVAALLLYIYFYSLLVHDRWLNVAHDPKAEKIIGGFPKTRVPSVAPTPEDQIWGSNRDPNLVWPTEARAKTRVLLTALYLLLIVAGTVGLTYGGATVIASRAPRIEEFSIVPARMNSGEVAMVRWRVVNADDVHLKDDAVASLGSLPIRPQSDSSYTLTAKNRFATRGILQSVVVNPSSPEGSPSRPGPSVPPNAIALEARDCSLIENVVIRGEGWLQSEGPGPAEAQCIVTMARAGRYEIFVDYASPESRPVRIALNSTIIAENGLAATTGGAGELNRLDQSLGVQSVRSGANILQFRAEHPFPYIRRIRFQPT